MLHHKGAKETILRFCGVDIYKLILAILRKEGRLIIESKKLALRIAAIARAKKAQGVIILDMQRVSSFCDYFIILSGTSLRQVNAIAQAIQEDLSRPSLKSKTALNDGRDLEKDRIKSLSKVSPNDESGWIVLDYTSIIVHIFYKPMREFYSLERLWSDAKRVRITKRL